MNRCACCLSIGLCLALFLLPSIAGPLGSVYHVEKMNTAQIRSLDRNRTAVLLPGGILEEHGPYLPVYTDGILSERMTELLSRAIAQAGWDVLVFPTIPLGSAGSNEYGNKYTFPGTYAVRAGTLRAIFMDLSTELGEQGFRWVFVIHVHGAGPHNRAIDQAGDYFHDTYGGQMIHLWGQVPVIQGWGRALQQSLGPAEQSEEGAGLHAGLDETSLMLHLEPTLVSPQYKHARPVTGVDVPQSVELAKDKGWDGYFGSPRRASAALGEKIWKSFSSACIEHALKILGGADNSRTPRYGDMQAANSALAAVDRASRAHEREIEAKQRAWLRGRGLE